MPVNFCLTEEFVKKDDGRWTTDDEAYQKTRDHGPQIPNFKTLTSKAKLYQMNVLRIRNAMLRPLFRRMYPAVASGSASAPKV